MARFLMCEEKGGKPFFFHNWLRDYPKEGDTLCDFPYDAKRPVRYKITKELSEGDDYKHYEVERIGDDT